MLARALTARSLAIDAVTAEVVRALRAEGIRAIVLKGPSLAAWLYDDGTPRPYVDSDLLVSPGDHARSERVLQRLGFEQRPPEAPPPELGLPHSRGWDRPRDGAQVDLHRTLFGLGVAPEEAWAEVSRITEPMAVGGEQVEVLDLPARALVVALHAAQHGEEYPGPIEDLRRAVARAGDEVWAEATARAAKLEVVQTFASGLRFIPEGRRLAERLPVFSAELIASATAPRSVARLALGFERLAATRGTRAKLRLVARELFPSAAFLRWWSPLARRGRLGLLAARLWRPLWLTRHALPSYLAWRRAHGGPAASAARERG